MKELTFYDNINCAFLKSVGDEVYEFQKIELLDQVEDYNMDITNEKPFIVKNPVLLLSMNVPFSDKNMPRIVEKNQIIISKYESQFCIDCNKYSSVFKRCVIREYHENRITRLPLYI